MCGIVGAISTRNVVPILVDGLLKLEYRGYDSSGVSIISEDGDLHTVKEVGKVENTKSVIEKSNISGKIGIAHTRWATHGEPSQNNSHPHVAGNRISLVHNGIIENYLELKNQVKNYEFKSDTDSEVISVLIYKEVHENKKLLLHAVQSVIKLLRGAFAIAVIDNLNPGLMVAARNKSPLCIGCGIEENFVSSDPIALHKVTSDFIFLEDQDVVAMSTTSVEFYDFNGNEVNREVFENKLSFDVSDKGEHRHYMHKEMFEQPSAINDTIIGRISRGQVLIESFGRDIENIFDRTNNLILIACGTSHYACCVARYWIESLVDIPVTVEVASEFRYRKKHIPNNTLFVTLSQSGETADTLAALRHIKRDHYEKILSTLSICNVPNSSLVRESDYSFLTHAGPEIGVASTKAFTTQLVSLLMLSLSLARKNNVSRDVVSKYTSQLSQLPQMVSEFLSLSKKIKSISSIFDDAHGAIFLGRGEMFPIALEGALKMKEITYINAQAYPAGELKHGPLALVDRNMPVVINAPDNELFDKLACNIQEVMSRGGKLIIFTDNPDGVPKGENVSVIEVPSSPTFLSPILYSIPIQLLAYHVAVRKGTDVDQPRNLAKSVTVE